ncbi:MAG: hypothetical protein ACOCXH_15020 [Cyclobacteriaceae bacterium]
MEEAPMMIKGLMLLRTGWAGDGSKHRFNFNGSKASFKRSRESLEKRDNIKYIYSFITTFLKTNNTRLYQS